MAKNPYRPPTARPRLGGAHRRRKEALAKIETRLKDYVPQGVRAHFTFDGGARPSELLRPLGAEEGAGKASVTIQFDRPIPNPQELLN